MNLHLDDGRLAPLTDRPNFEHVTSSELERSLRKPGVSPSATLLKTNAARTLFAFKPREGGLGVLQILEPTDQPPSVKLPYKRVQSSK